MQYEPIVPDDTRATVAARQGKPCPNGTCPHDLASHCRHGERTAQEAWHCTGGCRCGEAEVVRRFDHAETATAAPGEVRAPVTSLETRRRLLEDRSQVTHLEPRRPR